VFFAREDIAAGQELSFDYGRACADVRTLPPVDTVRQPAGGGGRVGGGARRCRCGAQSCRGWF
jgi:SET domain-containing protein